MNFVTAPSTPAERNGKNLTGSLQAVRKNTHLPGSARLLVVFLLGFYGNDVHRKCRMVTSSISGPHAHQRLRVHPSHFPLASVITRKGMCPGMK